MNLTNIKSIDKIAADLRAKGELNEEKWKALQSNRLMNSIIIYIFALLILIITWAIGKILWFVFICTIVGFLWCLFKKGIKQTYLLYTIGEKAIAEVVKGRFEIYSVGSWNNYYYACEFFALLNVKHLVEYRGVFTSDNKEERPAVGDKIEILYLKENPNISVRYSNKLEQKYNLKK